MRKLDFFLGLVFVFITYQSFGQLFVGANSYLYVADQYFTVVQNINLNSTGHIYLRNDSQVLQKTTSTSANSGLGVLSVFQEGTVNNFQYNYWSSPVGSVGVGSGNLPFRITQLHQPATLLTSSPAVMMSNSALDGLANPLSIARRWVYKFLSSETYSDWLYVGVGGIGAGEGFTMKGTSGTDNTSVLGVVNNPGSRQRYDFRGRPNDGNISISIVNGKSTLTGNPYPSAIDLRQFLVDGYNGGAGLIDGTALFWEHDKSVNSHILAAYRGGYGVYNGTTNLYTPATFYNYDGAGNQTTVASSPMNYYERRFSPIGQGFMLRGIATGTLQMRNTYRVYVKENVLNQSQFERNSNIQQVSSTDEFYDAIPNVANIDYTQISKLPTPHLKINTLLNNQAVRQVLLCFMDAAVDGLDGGDSKSPDSGGNLPFDTYFYLANDEYVHSTTSFDITKRFPLGFKNTSSAVFKIQVAEMVNFSQADEVYLHDKVTGLYHDIKNQAYEFGIEPGVHNDRYEITFLSTQLSLDENEPKSLQVIQNNELAQIQIYNPNRLEIQNVAVYDLSGKLILNPKEIGNLVHSQIATQSLSDGVYIVHMITSEQKNHVHKIQVLRSKK
ncbi:T9SS type A sorting domain-containing protein [Flavobacterium sp.]|uniref:T9SS type A sorting domain-containing protein n=1 Tax=Flavobacterium sp. TaxID=239 RepID=UPI002FDB935C